MQERILFEMCPLCESDHFQELKKGDCSGHFSYNPILSSRIVWHVCSDCGHVFTEGYYTEQACEIIFSKTQEIQKLGFNIEQNRSISSRMIEKVLPYVSHGHWLDIGFGNGSLLFTAQEYGFTPVGVDLREGNVTQLRNLGIEAYCQDIATLNLPNQCSVISMMDVLEHMPFPKIGLMSANKLLKGNGILFLSMPNSENMVWQTMDYQNINPYWGELEHYHNFSRSRLYALLEEHGFSPVRYGISERYRVCMEVIAVKTRDSTSSTIDSNL